jgi:hypothetical protein
MSSRRVATGSGAAAAPLPSLRGLLRVVSGVRDTGVEFFSCDTGVIQGEMEGWAVELGEALLGDNETMSEEDIEHLKEGQVRESLVIERPDKVHKIDELTRKINEYPELKEVLKDSLESGKKKKKKKKGKGTQDAQDAQDRGLTFADARNEKQVKTSFAYSYHFDYAAHRLLGSYSTNETSEKTPQFSQDHVNSDVNSDHVRVALRAQHDNGDEKRSVVYTFELGSERETLTPAGMSQGEVLAALNVGRGKVYNRGRRPEHMKTVWHVANGDVRTFYYTHPKYHPMRPSFPAPPNAIAKDWAMDLVRDVKAWEQCVYAGPLRHINTNRGLWYITVNEKTSSNPDNNGWIERVRPRTQLWHNGQYFSSPSHRTDPLPHLEKIAMHIFSTEG